MSKQETDFPRPRRGREKVTYVGDHPKVSVRAYEQWRIGKDFDRDGTVFKGASRLMASEHFALREFFCKCGECNFLRLNRNLPYALELLREAVTADLRRLADRPEDVPAAGAPLIIDSAYRCAKHNRKVSNTKDSFHKHGYAADVRCNYCHSAKIFRLAVELRHPLDPSYPVFGGVIKHEGMVHVDVRPPPQHVADGRAS